MMAPDPTECRGERLERHGEFRRQSSQELDVCGRLCFTSIKKSRHFLIVLQEKELLQISSCSPK